LNLKKICAVVAIIVLISTFSVTSSASGSLIELSAEDKILAFLSDVVKLDFTKYVATINSAVDYPSDLGGLLEETGKCTLESTESKIEILYTFKNGTLGFCNMYIIKGSPIYTQQPSANILEMADDFLQRYQEFTDFSDLTELRDALGNINNFENTTKTTENIKITLSVSEVTEGIFEWERICNGINFPSLYVGIRNGAFAGLADDFHVYSIGSTEVKISRETAVNIAMERARNISWKVNVSDTSVVEVANVTILEDRTSAGLLSMSREPLVLYPYWEVSLTFDKIYPGSVYGVAYNIWADTGEVFYGHLVMAGGSIPNDDNPTTSSNPTISPSPQHSALPQSSPSQETHESEEPTVPLQQPDVSKQEKPENTFPLLATIAVTGIAVVASTAILFKRKKKR
jgi:hypothetical protein